MKRRPCIVCGNSQAGRSAELRPAGSLNQQARGENSGGTGCTPGRKAAGDHPPSKAPMASQGKRDAALSPLGEGPSMPVAFPVARSGRSGALALALVRQPLHLPLEVLHRPMQFAQVPLHLLQPLVALPRPPLRARAALAGHDPPLALVAHALGKFGQARRPQVLHRLAQVLMPLLKTGAGLRAALPHFQRTPWNAALPPLA